MQSNNARSSSSVNSNKAIRAIAASVMAFALLLVLLPLPALSKSPPNFEKKLRKGYRQLQIGNTDKALKIFRGKVNKYPQSGACHTAYGRALKRKGKHGQAQSEFKKATHVEPKYAPGYYYLGVSLEQEKKWKQAADAFQSFVDLEPNNGKNVKDRITHCRNQI